MFPCMCNVLSRGVYNQVENQYSGTSIKLRAKPGLEEKNRAQLRSQDLYPGLGAGR